jgi:hypothetical protein
VCTANDCCNEHFVYKCRCSMCMTPYSPLSALCLTVCRLPVEITEGGLGVAPFLGFSVAKQTV